MFGDSKVTKKNISRNTAIKNLWEAYGKDSLIEGRVLRYEDLEKVLNEKRTTQRFKGIIGRWKDEVLTLCGKVLLCRINIGYEIADTHQRLSHAHSLQKSGVKKLQKSIVVQDTVHVTQLTQDERTLYQKMRNVAASLDISYKRELEMPSI